MVQLLHSYMTTRKTIALTILSFIGNVMSLLFNMLSMFITTSLPKSKHLLTICSDFGAQENKICHCSHNRKTPSICHEVMGLDAMILVFNAELQASFVTLLFYPHQEAL